MIRKRGFTLIEMLVALALGMIIIGITVAVFSQASRLFRLSQAKIRALNNAQAALTFIEADLTGAFISTATADHPFVGINDGDAEQRGIDNDNSGVFDDDNYDFTCDGAGLYDYLSLKPDYRYRSGMELNSASQYSYGLDGLSAKTTHVLYYVTQDRQVGEYTVGRLIRYVWDFDVSRPLSVFDPLDYRTYWVDDPGNSDPRIRQNVLAFGVVRFRLRYFDGSSWSDSWDSSLNPNLGTLPDVVHVELDVIDSRGVLADAPNEPYRLSRLLEIGM